MASAVSIPTIDLSTFFLNEEDREGKKKVTDIIKQACSEYGLFQVVNHGVPIDFIHQAMELSLFCWQEFFDQPWWIFCWVIVTSQDPTVLSLIFQDDAGGLEVLIDREWIPVTPTEGALVFHISDVLQVTKKLLINKSYKMKCFRFDCINFILANCLNVCMANWQVLTNDRFVSHFHQVVRPKGKSRNVFVFFYNLNGDKWVELLPQFSKEIGEPPKYRRFQYKDYFGVRVKEKLNPPARHEDKTTLITFASAT